VSDTVPVLEARGVTKYYGSVRALNSVSLKIYGGAVTCLLGDNGAGKSTLIKILSGVETPDSGSLAMNGDLVSMRSPGQALERGIATVFQDLAMIAMLPVYRNFFMGREPVKGWGPARRLDRNRARRKTLEQLRLIGVAIDDPARPMATLSGGQRQSVAIARAMYFGARILLLDEPTSALGVKQAETVLRNVMKAKERGVGVVLITHNAHHAWPVGDRFVVLRRGEVEADVSGDEVTLTELIRHMAGGVELDQMQRDLKEVELRS
jgi:simple sugar transport system ATP-binding protein